MRSAPSRGEVAQPATRGARNPTEESLVTIWQEVLKRAPIGTDDNFFEMGGHSLTTIRLLGRVAKGFGVRLPLKALFDAPTIGAFAEQLTPKTALEAETIAIWKDILKKDRIGLHDNFFDLGGHSFLLLKVHQRLSSLVEKPITVADLFRFPNVHSLARHLAEQPETTNRPSAPGRLASRRAANPGHSMSRDIAIVGLAGRFPGARNVREFWRNVCEGRETVSFFSPEELQSAGIDPAVLADPNYIRAKGVIDDVEMFDAGFFGINPPEAEVMDPQHRIFLECAWEALEDASCDPSIYEGAIGVFAGASMNTYLLKIGRAHV